MTKRSTRVASFIMAVIMLLVSVLFTEFGTIKVSAAAADGNTSLSGSSYPSSDWGARQDYAIRVFPIPAGLIDYYTTQKDVENNLVPTMKRIKAKGWNASLSGGTFGAYRTKDCSVWVFPREGTTTEGKPTMFTDYVGDSSSGSFKGYGFSSIENNVISYKEIESASDDFTVLFEDIAYANTPTGIDYSHIGNVVNGGGLLEDDTSLSELLNSAIAKYRRKHASDNSSLLNAFKKHLTSTDAQKKVTALMDKGQVTLAFEIYIGAGRDSQTTQMFSVTALQDYANVKERTGGAFSNNYEFKYAPDGSYRFALWYSFGIAFNALMPGYFTSDEWYKQISPTSHNVTSSDGETKIGGGGWCFYSFKTKKKGDPPKPTPTTADLTLYFSKSVTLSGEGAKPNVEVRIAYPDVPYAKNMSLDAGVKAYMNAVTPKEHGNQSEIASAALAEAHSYLLGLSTPETFLSVTTKNRKATITYKGLNVNKKSIKNKTVYFIPVYESNIVNGVRHMGTWGTKPAGLIRAEYAYKNNAWGWTTSYSPLYQIKTGSGYGTSSQTANRTISFVNTYKTRGRDAISLNYGSFTINHYDRFNLTYKKGSWTGSALDGESRLVYTTATRVASGTTFRLASGSSAFLKKQSDTKDLSDFAEATLKNASQTKTINMPERGTAYNRSNSNIRVNVLSGKTTEFKVDNTSLALLNATNIYSTSAMTKNMLGYSYDTTVSRRLVADTKYTSQVYTLKKGQTYKFNVSDDRKLVSSSTDVAKELNSFGNYSAHYALYEGAIARNYGEFELYLNYYAKQFTWLRSQAEAAAAKAEAAAAKADATSVKSIKQKQEGIRDGYLAAMKALTGYTYKWNSTGKTITASVPSGSTIYDLYGNLNDKGDKDGKKALCHSYVAVTTGSATASVKTSLKKPTSTSTMGKWFSKAESFANTLVSLDSKRPAASITAMTNYVYTDEGNHFQTAKAPEYYLSMNWADENFLLHKNTAYTRNTIYDFNAMPGLSRYSKTTAAFSTPAMQYNNHSTYFRPLYLLAKKTTSSLEADLKTASKYNATAYSLRNQLNANINLDSGSDKVAVTLYGSTFSGGTSPSAFNNSITTSYDYNVFSTYWKVAGGNTKGIYLPSDDYAKAFFGKGSKSAADITTLATAFSAKRANKGTNTSTQKLTGTASLRIAHKNAIKECDTVSYDVFEHHAALPVGNTCFIAGVSNLRSSTVMSLTPATSNASWSAQSIVNKLSVEFTAFKSKPKAKTKITAGTSEDGSKGWFERTKTNISVYPLVKMAYQTQNDSTLKYTYIVGSTARTIPATTYYTVSIAGTTGNIPPKATALALASDSRALNLPKKLKCDPKTPVAYSGTGVQISETGSTTLEFKAYSLINADAGAGYQTGWGNTNETGGVLSTLLRNNSLGFTTKTITDTTTGKSYLGIDYSSVYTVKLGEKTWDMKSSVGGCALPTGDIKSSLYTLKIAGGQVVEITIDGSTISAKEQIKSKVETTLPATTTILNRLKGTHGDLYNAMIKMGITGNPKTDIIYLAFAHNEGDKVDTDANGKKATGLLLGGGENWYNEYCNCLAIKMETVQYALNNKPVIDKIPIEAGPAQPTDKSKYFTSGYKFSVIKRKVKIGNKLIENEFKGAQPQFIVSDVPVTAAH